MAMADRVGFNFTADRAGRFGTQIEVRAGDKKDDLKLKLTPTGAINGRVVDADGEPVEGCNSLGGDWRHDGDASERGHR